MVTSILVAVTLVALLLPLVGLGIWTSMAFLLAVVVVASVRRMMGPRRD